MRVSVCLIQARNFGYRVAHSQLTGEWLRGGAMAVDVARYSDKAASLPKAPSCSVYQYLLLRSLREGSRDTLKPQCIPAFTGCLIHLSTQHKLFWRSSLTSISHMALILSLFCSINGTYLHTNWCPNDEEIRRGRRALSYVCLAALRIKETLLGTKVQQGSKGSSHSMVWEG